MIKGMTKRIIVGTIASFIVAVFVFFSTFPIFSLFFITVLATIVAIAFWEFCNLAKAKGFNPLMKLGIVFSVFCIFSNFFAFYYANALLVSFAILYLFIVLSFLLCLFRIESSLIDISITIFGFIYVVLPLSLIVNITYFAGFSRVGAIWLAYLLLVTKGTDIAAYFVGSTFGKRILAAKISPSKTLEGLVGGILGALIISVMFHFFVGPYLIIPFSLFTAIGLGVLIGAIGQFGDLAESLLKRSAGVKDSNKLPGLGGILDMVDSLIFTTPIIYLFLKFYL